MKRSLAVVAVALMSLGVACGSDDPAPSASGSDDPVFPIAVSPYEPEIDPADFVEEIDHPFMPFLPGTRYHYRGTSEGERESIVVIVTGRTREVLGVTCTVVKDVVRQGGDIVEKTFDWFAQDRFGNVWYFGEDSVEYENGKPANTHGSWEAGVDGALPGIVMLGEPQVGDLYRQEFYEGEAEDMAEVLKLDASITVPSGDYNDVLVTKDYSPLETQLIENKYYAAGVGVVYEKAIKGGPEEVELVRYESP